VPFFLFRPFTDFLANRLENGIMVPTAGLLVEAIESNRLSQSIRKARRMSAKQRLKRELLPFALVLLVGLGLALMIISFFDPAL
jgi:hypothetical protein